MSLIGLILVLIAAVLVIIELATRYRTAPNNSWGHGVLIPIALLLVIAALALFGVNPLIH